MPFIKFVLKENSKFFGDIKEINCKYHTRTYLRLLNCFNDICVTDLSLKKNVIVSHYRLCNYLICNIEYSGN